MIPLAFLVSAISVDVTVAFIWFTNKQLISDDIEEPILVSLALYIISFLSYICDIGIVGCILLAIVLLIFYALAIRDIDIPDCVHDGLKFIAIALFVFTLISKYIGCPV